MIKYIILTSFASLIFSFCFLLDNSWSKIKSNNYYEKFYVSPLVPQHIDKDSPLFSIFYFSDLIKVTPILKPVNKKKSPTFIPKSNID